MPGTSRPRVMMAYTSGLPCKEVRSASQAIGSPISSATTIATSTPIKMMGATARTPISGEALSRGLAVRSLAPSGSSSATCTTYGLSLLGCLLEDILELLLGLGVIRHGLEVLDVVGPDLAT